MTAKSTRKSNIPKPVNGYRHLIGQRIVAVRPMTDEEYDELWVPAHRPYAVVIVLENGTLLYPTSDEEGNDAGVINIQTPDGKWDLLYQPTK